METEKKDAPEMSQAAKSAQVVEYVARDGQQIMLDFETVLRYLVKGKKEFVTTQELVMFLGVCKSRGLNPFIGDCHLVKYTETDSAQIITSIDFYRKRARAMEDCEGWSKGIILQREKDIVYSKGLMLEGDILLGGWFKAQPKGWAFPLEHEINLSGFIKYKRDGTTPTQFWAPEKQPHMIAKVAESQGLRTAWPDEFQNLYTEEEVLEDILMPSAGDLGADLSGGMQKPGDDEGLQDPGDQDEAPTPMEVLATALEKDLDDVNAYVDFLDDTYDVERESIVAQALEDIDSFNNDLEAWKLAKEKEKDTLEDPGADDEKEPGDDFKMDDDAKIKLFSSKQSSGFKVWVQEHMAMIMEWTGKPMQKLDEKWEKLYGKNDPKPWEQKPEEPDDQEPAGHPDDPGPGLEDPGSGEPAKKPQTEADILEAQFNEWAVRAITEEIESDIPVNMQTLEKCVEELALAKESTPKLTKAGIVKFKRFDWFVDSLLRYAKGEPLS